jgi:hypothetical protein
MLRSSTWGLRWGAVRILGMEEKMDLTAQFEALQKRTSEATSAVRAATTEPREQVWQRIDQAQVDVNVALTDAKQQAGRAPSKWAQMKADAAAKREDVKSKIDKRADRLDADTAAAEAEWTEGTAADAIDLASWAVENARLAALDAVEARAYADELAKSGS